MAVHHIHLDSSLVGRLFNYHIEYLRHQSLCISQSTCYILHWLNEFIRV